MSYGSDYTAVSRRAAFYVAKILQGTAPGDLPVEQATFFEFYKRTYRQGAWPHTFPHLLPLDAQLAQLRGAGCTEIYCEKVTGAHSDRRQLLKMLDLLAPGDVETVTRIDRLARSTFDLFAHRRLQNSIPIATLVGRTHPCVC